METLHRQAGLDLLLSDIEMPGTNGFELARRVEIERPDTRILLISGFTPRSDLLDPAWYFLEKPFTPAKLLETVRECLGRG